MEDFFNDTLLQADWFKPVIITLILLPLLIMAFNEFLFRAEKQENRLVPPIRLLRNFVFPLIAIFIVINQIYGVSRETTPLKIIETLIYILILNTLLAGINVLFFSSGKQSLIKTNIPQLFLDIFRIILVLLGTAIILSVVWGTDLGSMVTALGVGSFVLGLALQDTLGNLFSGIALIYEKPFKVGDYIQIDDWAGEVIELNWRAVRIVTDDNIMVTIPHLVIGSGIVQNFSSPTEIHIVNTDVEFSYHIPPNKVKQILAKLLNSMQEVHRDSEPTVIVKEYKKHAIIYTMSYAIENYGMQDAVVDKLMTRLWYIAKRDKLERPTSYLQINEKDNESAHTLAKELQIVKVLDSIKEIIPIKEKQLEQIKEKAKLRNFGAGEQIVYRGEMAGDFYFIHSGKAKIQTYPIKKGQEQFLYKGDFFGELSMLKDRKSSYSVEAVEDVDVLVIAHEQVIEMVEDNPQLAFYLNNEQIHLN